MIKQDIQTLILPLISMTHVQRGPSLVSATKYVQEEAKTTSLHTSCRWPSMFF